MLLYVGISLLALLIIALGVLIGFDAASEGKIKWIRVLRDWQGLFGSVVGFTGASGILVLSLGFQGGVEQRRAEDAALAIGKALTFEAESMNTAIVRANGMKGVFFTSTDQSVVGQGMTKVCGGLITDLDNTLLRKTPVYDAGITRLVDFGDRNLALFVKFYALYAEIARDLDTYIERGCPAVTEQTAAAFFSKVDEATALYNSIGRTYDEAISQSEMSSNR